MDLEAKAKQLRLDILSMCGRAGTGHVTSSFSCVEIMVALYYKVMRIQRFNISDDGLTWEIDLGDSDRFILSKAQASPLAYAVLADLGYFPKDWLDTFCQKDGHFGVHTQADVPGMELTAGSLGHGLGIAAGMALALQKDRKKNLIFCLLGDGELYEGSNWESALFASHNRLNNLVAIVDRNGVCATNFVSQLSLEPMKEKFLAFGWDVAEIDGHSFDDIFEALKDVRTRRSTQPLCILADTVKGKGVEFISDDPAWHARALVNLDLERAREELNVG